MSNLPVHVATGRHPVLTWSSVGIAMVSLALLGLAWAGRGGGGASAVLALVAFVVAVAARLKQDRSALLWLPLLLFPVLLVTSPLWV